MGEADLMDESAFFSCVPLKELPFARGQDYVYRKRTSRSLIEDRDVQSLTADQVVRVEDKLFRYPAIEFIITTWGVF